MNWQNAVLQKIALCAFVGLLSSCAVLHNKATFESFDASRGRASSLYVLDDVHALNPRLESRVAEDLREALVKLGLQVLTDPAKADLVLLPTLGRIRGEDGGFQTEAARSDLLARTGSRLLPHPASGMTQAQERSLSHYASASFHSPEWRVGLLLTAYDRKAYLDFDPAAKALNPVWRTYAGMAIDETSWQAAAKPLIEAIAASVDEALR